MQLHGSSPTSIPFAFPDGDVADSMKLAGYPTSGSRVEQLTVLYWDAIDAKAIAPLKRNGGNGAGLNYLMANGVSQTEAAAYIAGMLQLSDPSWLVPNWTLMHGGVGGAAGKLLGDIPWLTIALAVGGIAILYGVATTGTKTLLARRV